MYRFKMKAWLGCKADGEAVATRGAFESHGIQDHRVKPERVKPGANKKTDRKRFSEKLVSMGGTTYKMYEQRDSTRF